jgi:hypothetical protein
MAAKAEEQWVRKQRLAAVHEHERLLADTHPLSERTLQNGKIEDTEPCLNGTSRLHSLTCGHIVHTPEPTVCGRTCEMPIGNFDPFVCTLCERWSMVQKRLVSKRSSQIADLILPDFPEVDQSHIPVMLRARSSNTIYTLLNGGAIVLAAVEVIAVVRVLEIRRMAKLISNKLPEVSWALGYSSAVVKTACESLSTCVEHQHLWATASHETLAVACLYVAAQLAGVKKPGDLIYMVTCLGVDLLEAQELVPKVTKLLIDLDMRAVLASFIPIFEKCFPRLVSKANAYASMALKLWKKVSGDDVCTPGFKRKYWLRIVASCIFTVMLRNELTPNIDRVCAAVGTSSYGNLGNQIDVDVALQVVGSETYSLDSKSSGARRLRKLKMRAQRHNARELSIPEPGFAIVAHVNTTQAAQDSNVGKNSRQLQCNFSEVAMELYEHDENNDRRSKRRCSASHKLKTIERVV